MGKTRISSTKGIDTGKISFDFDTLSWRGLTESQINLWRECYPDVDVLDILSRKMIGWLDANKGGKAQKKKWKQFICNWLSREQEKFDRFKNQTRRAV